MQCFGRLGERFTATPVAAEKRRNRPTGEVGWSLKISPVSARWRNSAAHQCPTYGSGLGLALFFRPSQRRDFFGPASRESRASAQLTRRDFERRDFQSNKKRRFCLLNVNPNIPLTMLDDNNDACKSLAHKKVEYNYQNKFFTAAATISVIMAPPSCFVCLKVSLLKVSLSQLRGCAKFPAGWPKKVSRQAWPEERHET